MIHLSCALKCEAAPILECFTFSLFKDSVLFPLYLDQQNNLSLTLTGTGKTSAAAAAINTYSLLGANKNDAWLNIGITGHGSSEIGAIYLANRIRDNANGNTWYPQIMFKTSIPSENLLTVETPGTEYTNEMLDMEASGFISSVSRFATFELAHSLKVISDNDMSSQKKISSNLVTSLIHSRITDIETVINAIGKLARELQGIQAVPDAYEIFIQHWHFTKYQQGQLQRLLRRMDILIPDKKCMLDDLLKLDSGKSVLKELSSRLDKIPINFSHTV